MNYITLENSISRKMVYKCILDYCNMSSKFVFTATLEFALQLACSFPWPPATIVIFHSSNLCSHPRRLQQQQFQMQQQQHQQQSISSSNCCCSCCVKGWKNRFSPAAVAGWLASWLAGKTLVSRRLSALVSIKMWKPGKGRR